MRRLLTLISTLVITLALHAQSDDEQVLVFRHSGEVNLFYASRLDRIELSAYDADSVLHDEVVSQVFYAEDTTMVIPIAEIDSVAFGSRNEIEMRPGVKDMTAETDLPWILRFDGESIYYRLNTPSSILPKVGERLFYGLDDNDSDEAVFPYGLTAKVTAVTTLTNEIRVDIEMVELNEIFSKLFFAGPIYKEKAVNVNKRRAPEPPEEPVNEFQWDGGTLEGKIPIGTHGEIKPNMRISAVGHTVMNPLRFYIRTDIDVTFDVGVNQKVYSRDSDNISLNTFRDNYIRIATFYRVINLSAAVGLFFDAKAEMALDMGVKRTLKRRLTITRTVNDTNYALTEVPGDEQPKDSAHVEVMLDGKMYLGPIFGMELCFAGKVLGVRANLKYGPEFEAKLNGGVLLSMRNYNPEAYSHFYLTERNKFALEGFLVYRRPWSKESLEVNKIFSLESYGQEHQIDLLPHYEDTRAVEATTQTETEVTTSTKVGNEILHELETGFEILDESDNIIDSVFVEDLILPDTTMVQGFDATFELPKRTNPDAHPLRVRPIFHYAGYTISAAPANVLHDSHIMPITAYGTNGVATYISGASVIGAFKTDSTTYHIGNFLPIPLRDPVFFPPGGYEPKTPGKSIDGNTRSDLYGTWMGEFEGDLVTLTFNEGEERTGTYIVGGKEQNFIYDFNNPQSGDIRLLMDDQTVMIISVVSVSDTTLVLRRKGKNQQYVLNRQY